MVAVLLTVELAETSPLAAPLSALPLVTCWFTVVFWLVVFVLFELLPPWPPLAKNATHCPWFLNIKLPSGFLKFIQPPSLHWSLLYPDVWFLPAACCAADTVAMPPTAATAAVTAMAKPALFIKLFVIICALLQTPLHTTGVPWGGQPRGLRKNGLFFENSWAIAQR